MRNAHRTSEMDGDPGVEPALDGISLILPLPYRVAIILVAGKKHAIHYRPKRTFSNILQAFGRGVPTCNISILPELYCLPLFHYCPMLIMVQGRSCAHQIPFSSRFTEPLTSRVSLPLRYSPHRTTCVLLTPFLGNHTSIHSSCDCLGDIASVVPADAGPRLRAPLPKTITQRTIPVSVDTEADQYRGASRSPRWEVWRHYTC